MVMVCASFFSTPPSLNKCPFLSQNECPLLLTLQNSPLLLNKFHCPLAISGTFKGDYVLEKLKMVTHFRKEGVEIKHKK